MKRRWNIFARVLEDILEAHNMRLGMLDDRMEIHREKVRRLQQSLLTPKHFPILNPEEIQHLVDELCLTEEERNRLRAAVLATAIEATLMERIDQDSALLAAEQIYPTILASIQKHADSQEGLGRIR